MIIEIENTLVSTKLLSEHFVCDLTACKGACCVEGDAGAPLEQEELAKLDEVWEAVKPYLSAEGIKSIEAQGRYVRDDFDGEWVTPLINHRECAYTVFEADGTAKCGLEQAWRDGKTSWQKPISCALYPVRVTRYAKFEAVNYHEWEICKPACACGKKLQTNVYKFLRGPLIRKYGEDWYKALEAADAAGLSADSGH